MQIEPKIVGKYKHYDIYDTIPEGWLVDKMYIGGDRVLISNGKSPLNGGKFAVYIYTEKELEDIRNKWLQAEKEKLEKSILQDPQFFKKKE